MSTAEIAYQYDIVRKERDQALATIVELRVKLVDSESLSKAFMSKLPNDYSWDECPSEYIVDMQDKLLEAEQRVTESDRSAATNAIELSRLRSAVPGDVEEALDKYEVTISDVSFCRASAHNALCDARDDAKEKLLTLIGALITRSEEARRTEIIDAFYTGTSWQFESVDASCEGSMKAAEEYADRILKGKNECKCANTISTSEITRQCQDCGRQWLGRMEEDNDAK